MNQHRLKRLTVLATCLISTLIVSCSTYAAISVLDDSGRTVSLVKPAMRVISLAPHITELVYAAGGGTKLVGAVNYSDYPSAARQIQCIGDGQALDLERIVALKPDLIIVWSHGNAPRQVDMLRALAIPLFDSEPHKLADIATNLERLGALLGTNATAHAAAAVFREKIAALRQRYAKRAPVQVFYQIWQRPLMTLNGTTIANDVIALCGGRNIFADLIPLAPTVSTEAVLVANPEVIIAPHVNPTCLEKLPPSLARWRNWPNLAAVANANLFVLDSDLIDRPGPRIIAGATQLCETLEVARQKRKKAAKTN